MQRRSTIVLTAVACSVCTTCIPANADRVRLGFASGSARARHACLACYAKACIADVAVGPVGSSDGAMVEREDCELLSVDEHGELIVTRASRRRSAVPRQLEAALRELEAEPKAERGTRALGVTAQWREGGLHVDFGFVSQDAPNAKLMRSFGVLLRDFLLPEAARECGRSADELPSDLTELLEQAVTKRCALRQLLTALITGSTVHPSPGSADFQAVLAASVALDVLVKEICPRSTPTIQSYIANLLASSHSQKRLFAELGRLRLVVGKLAVERRQDRTYASLNSSDPTAVFEKDYLLVLLFDNIGFRKSGFKVGYDQWVLLAWQYLTQAEQHELGLLGLSKEGIPFATAFPSEGEYVRAVLPADVDYENVSRRLSTLLDGALVNFVRSEADALPDPETQRGERVPKFHVKPTSKFRVRLPDTGAAGSLPLAGVLEPLDAADERAADEVEADEEDEEDEAAEATEEAEETGEVALEDVALGSARDDAAAELDELAAELDAFEGASRASAGDARADADDREPAAASAGVASAAPLNWFTAQLGTTLMENAVHGDLNKTQTVERIIDHAVHTLFRLYELAAPLPEELTEVPAASGALPPRHAVYGTCDGAPHRQIIDLTRGSASDKGYDRFRVLVGGPFHMKNELRLKLSALFETLELAIICRYRPYAAQMSWFLYATDPRQADEERKHIVAGLLLGWVEAYATWLRRPGSATASGAGELTVGGLHAYMMRRAAECPNAAHMMSYFSYYCIYTMITDSFTKTDAFPYGDFALYQSGVRLALAHVLTVSNAYNYVNIAFYLLTEWKLASPFEQAVMAKILFTARTSNLRTVPKDVLVECFVMCARYFLGKTTNKAGSQKTRRYITMLKELTASRLRASPGSAPRPADLPPGAEPTSARYATVCEPFQAARWFMRYSQIAILDAPLFQRKLNNAKIRKRGMGELFGWSDGKALNPAQLALPSIAAMRASERALYEFAHQADAPRPTERTDFAKLPVLLDSVNAATSDANNTARSTDAAVLNGPRAQAPDRQLLSLKSLKAFVEAARPLADAASPPLVPPLMDARELKRKTSAQRAELAAELARVRKALPALTATAAVRQTATLTVVRPASGEAPTLTVRAAALGAIEPLAHPLLALRVHAPDAGQRRADGGARALPPSAAQAGGSLPLSSAERAAKRLARHGAAADDAAEASRAHKKLARDDRHAAR